MSKFLRCSILVAALGAAFSAHAVSLDVVSKGHFGVSPFFIPHAFVNEEVLAQDDDSALGLPGLESLHYDLGLVGIFTGKGVGQYTNGSDSLNFFFEIPQVPAFDSKSLTATIEANWTFLGGTGAFAQYKSGSGTLGTTFNAKNNFRSMTTFSGELQAVPEPTSMAALAIGGLGILKRRKKA